MAAQLVGLFLSDPADVTDSELDLMLPEICARMDPELNDFFGSAPQVGRPGGTVREFELLTITLIAAHHSFSIVNILIRSRLSWDFFTNNKKRPFQPVLIRTHWTRVM